MTVVKAGSTNCPQVGQVTPFERDDDEFRRGLMVAFPDENPPTPRKFSGPAIGPPGGSRVESRTCIEQNGR